MERFLFISPVSDFNTSIERDFIYESLTTFTPFLLHTYKTVPETETFHTDGLMFAYGLGVLLIILVILTCCYRFIMPAVSDARLERMNRRNLANLRAQGGGDNFERINAHFGIVVPSQETSELSGHSQNAERLFPQRLQNLFRPNTLAKQVIGSGQVNNQGNENRDEAEREQLDCQYPLSLQQTDETKLDSESLEDAECPESVQKHLCQSYKDQNPNGEDNETVEHSKYPSGKCPSVERQTRSSPTSPDVRRRISAVEDTPRLSSSWR